ncbi:MAG: ZIP family metal transporter [Candidatus Methanomethylicia archaeon]
MYNISKLIFSIISVTIVSLISLIGVFALSLKEGKLHKILFILLGFSGGVILGSALLDLLPESIEISRSSIEELQTFIYITFGFILFFILERFIYWYHGHGHHEEIEEECKRIRKMELKELIALNVIGDAIHNFLDGMIISASYLTSIELGITTTIAVIFHELPQEIGDFGILIYGGLNVTKALMLNLLSALTSFIGVLVIQMAYSIIENISLMIIPMACGGFIYLAASEIIPELQKERNFRRAFIQLVFFQLGIILIWLLNKLI